MGLIIRAIRNKGNQQFAATRTAETQLSGEQVLAYVEAFCARQNAEADAEVDRNIARLPNFIGRHATPGSSYRYYCHRTADGAIVSFPRPHDAKVNTRSGRWRATVVLTPQPGGTSRVQLTLHDWVVDGEWGTIKFKDKYERFAADLRTVL